MRSRSNIFVLIDSLDSDVEVNSYVLSSDAMVNKVILKSLAWRNRVVYLISESRGKPLDTSDPGYDVYREVSKAVLGDIVSYDIQEWYQALSIMGQYNQNENIAVRYNFGSQDSTNISISGEDSGQFYALLSVDPNGILPNITNSVNSVKTVLNGKRFKLISFPADYQTLFVDPSLNWNLRVWTESSTTILLGYDFNQKTDVGSSYIPRDYKPILSGAVTNGVAKKTTLQWIQINDGSKIGTPLSAVDRQQECSYPFTFGTVYENCVSGPFGQEASIELSSGERITRIVPGYCASLDQQKPTEFVCYNGGTKRAKNISDCTQLYTGFNCGEAVCEYGGVPNLFPGNGYGPCTCKPGFSGDHCDVVNCTSGSTVLPSTRTTFALVVQNTLSQAHISRNISNGVNNLIYAMKGKNQFYNLMLTVFRTDENGQSDVDFSSHESISAFESEVQSIQYLPSKAGSQDVLHGIQAAALNIIYQYSAMFVFVDSPTSTTTSEMETLLSLVTKKIQLNFVITPPFGLPELCMNDTDTAIYQDLVSKTGGVLVNLCKPFNPNNYAADPISTIFSGYAASHHGTESINEFYEREIVADDEVLSFNMNIDQPQNDAFFIVNCPNTENFNANLSNFEMKSNIFLTSIASMPFLGVYKLPLFASTTTEYTVTVTKMDGIPFVAPCFMKVVLKSTEQVYLSFVHDGSQDASEQFLQFATPLNPVVHISSDRLNRNFTAVIASFQTTHTSDLGITRNGGCTYEYFFPSEIACGLPSQAYIFNIFGTTLDGQTYMRSIRSFCFQKPGKCQNGGTFIDGPTPKCTCPPNYTGPFCQDPICQNNARETSEFTCYCGQNNAGEFCNLEMCDAYNFMESVDPRTFDARQVTFVLNRNVENLLVNTQLSNNIRDVVSHVGSFGAPTLFSLVVFDGKYVQSVVSTSNIDQFVSSFQNSFNPIDSSMPETTRSIDAINEAFKLNIQPPGIFFVFTPNEPSSPDQTMIDKFLTQRLDTQVNIFYTPTARNGYPTLPVSSNTTDLLYQTVKQSGGRFLPLTQNSISQINPLLTSAFTQKELVFDDTIEDCSSMKSFYFDLESAFGSAEITISGFDVSVPGKVEIYSGDQKLKIGDENIIFKDNAVFVLWYINLNYAGKWTVRVQTTTGSCGCQVRVASDTRVVPGFTADMSKDFVYSMPFTGQGTKRDTYAVYRITNSDSEYAPYLQYMKVSKTNYVTPYTERSPLVQLGVQQRDISTCAYQFLSEKWTVDPFPYQKVVLQGNDSSGTSWMRTFYYTFPTSNSISTCINGKPDTFGQCICSDNTKWTGENCDTPVCQNGGTASYGICICINGYYGQFCELLVSKKN